MTNKKKALPKNQKSFEKEIVINADSAILVPHGKNTKRLIVSAKDERGKALKIKYRKIGDTQLKVFNRTDSAIRMKLTVTPKEPLDNKGWYKTAQCVHVR